MTRSPGRSISLVAAADRVTAAATVLVGGSTRRPGARAGRLISGKYASTVRFLEVEGGLSTPSARAMLGRSRDLREDYSGVGESWLAGRLLRRRRAQVTLGIRTALKAPASPAVERDTARAAAVAVVLPGGETRTVADVKRVSVTRGW